VLLLKRQPANLATQPAGYVLLLSFFFLLGDGDSHAVVARRA
jgi:hypothetical protein